MSTASPLIPLELRLQALEAQIRGVPTSYDNPSPRPDGPSVTRRLRGIEDRLERVGSESEALKRLLGGYEAYKHLLNIPGTIDSETTESKAKENEDGPEAGIRQEDLLPDPVKVAMLLEAKGDILSAERDLREIERLKERGVEGSGNLEGLLELRPNLAQRTAVAQSKTSEINLARTQVSELLKRYNEFSGIVSDLFLDIHHRLEVIEDGVRRAERAKRKALQERY